MSPAQSSRLYLDHAATTPMTARAREAAAEGMTRWANPSSPHAEGRAARAALEDARRRIAAAYGWSGETILTGGASEGIAIVMGRAMPARRLILAVEHDAVLRHAEGAATVPVRADGTADPDALRAMLGGEPALVAAQWANSETGVRQPVEAIAAIVHAAGGLLMLDAAQMPPRADEGALRAADFVIVSAHKRGGPPGVGALLVRDLAQLMPTGGQEKGYRPGTENLPGALGFAAAVEEPENILRWGRLRTRLETALAEDAEVIGARSPRYPAIGAYRMPGVSAAAQLIRYDLAGIAVSAGSACSSGSMRPSHVLSAMGIGEAAVREVIRVSFGRDTSEADIDRFVAVWRETAREAKARAA